MSSWLLIIIKGKVHLEQRGMTICFSCSLWVLIFGVNVIQTWWWWKGECQSQSALSFLYQSPCLCKRFNVHLSNRLTDQFHLSYSTPPGYKTFILVFLWGIGVFVLRVFVTWNHLICSACSVMTENLMLPQLEKGLLCFCFVHFLRLNLLLPSSAPYANRVIQWDCCMCQRHTRLSYNSHSLPLEFFNI